MAEMKRDEQPEPSTSKYEYVRKSPDQIADRIMIDVFGSDSSRWPNGLRNSIVAALEAERQCAAW